MTVTTKIIMATTALTLMLGSGAHAADEVKKKDAPKKAVSKVVEVPPAVNPAVPPIMPPANGQIPMGGVGQPPMGGMVGMPMGQPPSFSGDPSGMGMMNMPSGGMAGAGVPMPEGTLYYYGKPIQELHQNMMMIRPSGDVDVDFVQGMLPHHRGAIDMAKIVLEKGKDPEIKKLATEILKAQEAEMKLMSDWISKKQEKISGTN